MQLFSQGIGVKGKPEIGFSICDQNVLAELGLCTQYTPLVYPHVHTHKRSYVNALYNEKTQKLIKKKKTFSSGSNFPRNMRRRGRRYYCCPVSKIIV